jgi:hypothetical protein
MVNLEIPGWMTEQELHQIEKWANEVPENGVIMEVGSLYGRSAYTWAKSCHPSVNVYCVDTFYAPQTDTDFHDEFHKNTKDIPNIHSIRAACPYFKYSEYVNNPADIFFVDAAHTNPNDWHIIQYGLRNLKSGGLLCGHDYVEGWPEVVWPPGWPDVVENVKRLEQQLGKPATFYPGTSFWSFVIDAAA